MLDQLALSPRARLADDLARAILDPEVDTARLDHLVESVPIAAQAASSYLSLLSDRQVTARATGAYAGRSPRGTELPLEDSICANALRSEAVMAISDTANDERVSSLPMVVDRAVGAYLGAPVHSVDGEMIGMLCVIDDYPRVWTPGPAGSRDPHR